MLKKGTDKASFKIIGAIGTQAERPIGNQNQDSYIQQFAANDNAFNKDAFVFLNARHLSEGTVAKGEWRSTTFSKEVLLKSLPLFNNLLVHFNHEISVEDCKGFCYAGQWDNGNEMTPAGINAIIALDTRKEDVNDIVKTANYPIKNPLSMSVTVEYGYEDSHDWSQLPQGTYWSYGMIAPDGKEITRNVTEIVKYYETSVVWEGADSSAKVYGEVSMPFAKNIEEYNNGNHNLSFEIDARKAQGSQIDSFNKEEKHMKVFEGTLVNEFETEITGLKSEKETFLTEIESYKAKVASYENEIIGLKETLQASELKIKAGEKALKDEFSTRIYAEKQVEDFTANEQIIKSEFETAKTELESFKTKFTEIEQYTNQKRQSVLANYNKVKLGETNELELQEIQNATLLQLETLQEKFVGGILNEFGAQCNECKSNDISVRSSLAEQENKTEKNTKKVHDFKEAFQNKTK